MIRDDAENLAARLQEAFGGPGAGITATSAPSDTRVEFAPPGGARPHIIRYSIRIADATREAFLGLDDAESLLGGLVPGWDPERVLAEVAARGFSVDDIAQVSAPDAEAEARDYTKGWF